MPAVELINVVFLTLRRPAVLEPTPIAAVAKPNISQFSTFTIAPELYRTPLRPVPSPLNRRLRRITTSPAPAATTIPFVPDTNTDATWPPPPSMVIALVIVTAPNPPGSRASISPPGAVFEIAPAQVLQGAVRLQGLASSPTPETHVRDACAMAGALEKSIVALMSASAT